MSWSTVSLILQAVIAALKFPTELSSFLKLIEKSSEQKRAEIVKQNEKWLQESAESDRPKWETQ
jgi:hypothetical protein